MIVRPFGQFVRCANLDRFAMPPVGLRRGTAMGMSVPFHLTEDKPRGPFIGHHGIEVTFETVDDIPPLRAARGFLEQRSDRMRCLITLVHRPFDCFAEHFAPNTEVTLIVAARAHVAQRIAA